MKHTLVAALALLLGASSANAAIITYEAVLSGLTESPPVVTTGSGSATLVYDSVLHTYELSADFENLIGTTTVAHIHCCLAVPLTGNVGVATPTPTFPGFPAGVTGGSYQNTFDMTLASSWSAAFLAANGGSTAAAELAFISGIAEGRAYLNIHSSFAQGGEIRGFFEQTAVVPEPGTYALMSAGLAGIALLRRRARR
jgi:hypothetical protein